MAIWQQRLVEMLPKTVDLCLLEVWSLEMEVVVWVVEVIVAVRAVEGLVWSALTRFGDAAVQID